MQSSENKNSFTGQEGGSPTRVAPKNGIDFDPNTQRKDSTMENQGSGFPLPEPIELAKLAAILRPHSKPADALKAAMKFYVEAVLFCRESCSMSFEYIVAKFGSQERDRALMEEPFKKIVQAQWGDTLELDPTKDDDPARQYLRERGLLLKKAESVLDNFRRSYKTPPNADWSPSRPSAESVIASCERTIHGRRTYALPKSMLDDIIRYARWHRRESQRTSQARKAAERRAQKPSNKNFKNRLSAARENPPF